MARKDDGFPLQPDSARKAADPFGKTRKKPQWSREAMEEALQKPHLAGDDDRLNELDREDLDNEKE